MAFSADSGLSARPGAFDTAFSFFDFSGGVLVATSGGSDSTALLLLIQDYLHRNAPRVRLLAATVDHDLRTGSATEARAVARLCTDRGIEHRTLLWAGDKPSTGLPAAAREARYRLLAQAARDAGASIIVTGHTADDQVETVLMRQERSDLQARGLAGMAPATLYGWNSWIVRPLLGTRRTELRDYLRSQKVAWCEDPTNIDQHFERPRIRAKLDESRFGDSVTLAARSAELREALGHRAAALIRSMASRPAPGLVHLSPDFVAADPSAAVLAVRVLLATMGGLAFPPDEKRTAALAARFSGPSFCATLSRTAVDKRRAGIFLRRELRDLPVSQVAINGMIWDGRRQFSVPIGSPTLVVTAEGVGKAIDAYAPSRTVPASLLRAAKAAEPRIRCASPELLSDNTPDIQFLPVVAPFASFLPSFDLELAEAVSALIGAAPLPPTPLKGRR